MDAFPHHDVEDKRDWYFKLSNKLRKYGLDNLTCSVLLAKFVFDWEMAEIMDEFNFVDERSAYRVYKRGLDLLRERGYTGGFKDEL